jgi:murein DD-endopeptidase MepM/ murein hydrolase activator NlpD
MGSLTFIWPTTERYLSGYDYSPETNHFGIDIAGDLGNPIFAADHGVVVYAGWNDYGYGEMIVIDHGSGWQTLYGHLNQVNVVCGQEVYQGDTIGLMGSTGKSTGPHLHFEMRSDKFGRVNPWDFLQ